MNDENPGRCPTCESVDKGLRRDVRCGLGHKVCGDPWHSGSEPVRVEKAGGKVAIDKEIGRQSDSLSAGRQPSEPLRHDPICACAACEQRAHERVTQEFERRRKPQECSVCRGWHGFEVIHASE